MLGKAVDDILCPCAYDADRFFVGTTAGLVSVSVKDSCVQPVYIGREQGLFNEMIHGIVKDGTGMLWLGTNRGMIKYDPVSGGSYTYYYSKGIEIGEFSDDSYYRCPYTGNIFLGGVNGLLWLDSSRSSALEYYPPLVLRRLVVDRKEASLDDFYSPDRKAIVLSEGQNTFSLQFVALDYLNPDIEYAYILEGYSDKWSFFSKENEAVFHRVPPGEYLFRVRYKKRRARYGLRRIFRGSENRSLLVPFSDNLHHTGGNCRVAADALDVSASPERLFRPSGIGMGSLARGTSGKTSGGSRIG